MSDSEASRSSWGFDVAAMAGSLAHEIKNPLSTISINAQLLLEDSKDPTSPREERNVRRLQVISSEIQRLERIVQGFLNFTENHELNLNSGDLNALLEELAEFVSPEAQKSHVRVHLGLASDLIEASFDTDLIRQVFLNLMQNAIQVMVDGGGELIVKSRCEEERGVSWIVGEIIDTGPGISERNLSRLFELYFSTKADGNGLGLAISKRIVEEHGGFIRVATEVDKGSQFSVYLPVHGGK